MEGVLWYLLASSRGGPTRVRILRAIDERPRNANQLATALDLDYTTVRHHLDVLLENNVVRKRGEEYAAVYLFTEQLESNWGTVEEILDTVDPDGGADSQADTDAQTGDDEAADPGEQTEEDAADNELDPDATDTEEP